MILPIFFGFCIFRVASVNANEIRVPPYKYFSYMRNFYVTLLGLGFVFVLTTAFNKTPTGTSEIETTVEQTLVFNTDGLYMPSFTITSLGAILNILK